MASQTEQKKTGLGDLPPELYDEVVYQAIDGFLHKDEKQALRQLMKVNKRFYNSCTRLIYRTAVLEIRNADPYIPDSFQQLSKSEHRQFVQHVDISSTGSSRWPNYAAKMQAVRDIPAVLGRFPALKSLHVDLETIAPPLHQLFGPQPPDHTDKVGLLDQRLGRDLDMYPNNIQALCLYHGMNIYRRSPGHIRSLNRIMPSLRHFKFVGGSLSIHSEGKQVLEALRYAKKLETLRLVGIFGRSIECITQIHRDIPLRRFDINEAMIPVSNLLTIANFASSLEALYIHGVWLTSGTWEGVFNSLCGARNITLFRGEDLGYSCNTFTGPFRSTASDDLALTRLKKQVSLNRERLGTITAYQSDHPCMSAVRHQVRCTVGEASVRW
ncbi:hypothetical protein ASPVEDRAFT_879797 [Aspergillus versicolor CBS 583.65]|uniref:F-box domain-containing protein n=1 Tax=Aspergillus versicolor CBS 583.65 TaxID=1036611 RepID=A0A1L9Q596_ASPVE|nr:uncharacterized protein ASPVEDRAFT_879797 [Aspergillus versicolor CBS 583.65]OJJ08916.1 hypothetical protein ASPVEDRAFT_879797 [Aspergillus versicolor CBS 583.65]